MASHLEIWQIEAKKEEQRAKWREQYYARRDVILEQKKESRKKYYEANKEKEVAHARARYYRRTGRPEVADEILNGTTHAPEQGGGI